MSCQVVARRAHELVDVARLHGKRQIDHASLSDIEAALHQLQMEQTRPRRIGRSARARMQSFKNGVADQITIRPEYAGGVVADEIEVFMTVDIGDSCAVARLTVRIGGREAALGGRQSLIQCMCCQ